MYAIVDIETTGFGGVDNKITEISIFVHNGQTIVDEFTTLVDPEVRINPRVAALTGISDDMVRTAPKFYEIAKKVVELTQDRIFVAHNVNFDYNIIKAELEALGGDFSRKKLCTVRLSRKLIPGMRSYSLGNLCSTLGIPIHARHRAKGDAEATVILLEKLLHLDETGVFESFLNPRSREATLPPLLPKSVIDGLPEVPGVYYFKDASGDTIYVGKAKDIKQRVLSHLYSKFKKEVNLCQATANITFTRTGNELTALLLESDEIKRIYPKFNRAQKRQTANYGLDTYQDRQGITHIVYGKMSGLKQPFMRFYSPTECRNFLEKFCDEYELCPRYCSLQAISGGCFHYQLKKCRGVCRDKESVTTYNQRVTEAIASFRHQDSYLITETGRTPDEQALILVRQGIYQGFGFAPIHSKSLDYDAIIEPKADNPDIQRILRAYLKKQPEKAQIVALPPKVSKTISLFPDLF
ncbi:DNA polymerase III subunit epsilon [Sediminicola luteus]|uniref:DNA polymerase III subunit epsilon n=2 Tax=Sediminicola luteus TaxID=319238 RepID=A0A2A4G7S8_9FLAO|nr:DNA polymerase III subunit epsilon [Sediminicola luteus]